MTAGAPTTAAPLEVGRYILYDAIASGGMAAVHLGRIVGPAGFSRVVAIKRLHPHLASDKKFAAMFLDEARVASRIHHPNVVGVIDVADLDGELFLVMDYVRGEPLSALLRSAAQAHECVPLPIVSALLVGVLYGLHAAHEARDETGRLMHVVHRDVSPQNVLVDLDGLVRVADFGIAKAISRLENTREGEIKGKLAYMAPEQLKSGAVDRRTDVYAASVVLWEALTGRRLFKADDAAGIMFAVMVGEVSSPSSKRPEVEAALDALVLRGLSREPVARFSTALEMADALANVVRPAAPREMAEWVARMGGAALSERSRRVTELEQQAIVPASDPRLADRKRVVEAVTLVGDAAVAAAAGPSPLDAVSAPPPPPTSRSVRWRVAGAFIAAAAVTAGFVAARSSLAPAPLSPPVPSAESASASPSTDSLEAATASSSATVASAVEPVSSPSVSASARANATAKARSPAAAPAPRHATRNVQVAPRTTVETTPKKTDCDPPFTIDENGIKRFKRWCPQ